MIHQETLEAVYPLADLLDERRIKVTPMQGTPIQELVNASHMPIHNGTSEDQYTMVDRLLDGSRRKGPDGMVEHDCCMDEVADAIATSVRYNLDLARNTVNPIVREVAESLQAHMEMVESKNQSHIEITPLTLPAIWNSPALEQMVERYAETLIDQIDMRLRFSLDTQAQPIEKYLHTGAARFDQEIDEFVEQMGPEYFVNVFNKYFKPVEDTRLAYSSHPKTWNEYIVVHLFSRYFLENPPDDANVGLSEYRAYMTRVMAQSGRLITSVMAQRQSERASRILVKYWPQEQGRERIYIEVNADVYNDFLEKGGSPEVILGAFSSDRNRGFTALLENSEYYEREWERKLRVLTTGRRLNRFNNAVDGMRAAMAQQINEIDTDILPVSKEILHRKLEENLSSLYGHWYESPYEYARVIVCKTLFPHTLALSILCSIDAIAKDNPGIEVRDAALLATIEIVANWVSKLCRVEYLPD